MHQRIREDTLPQDFIDGTAASDEAFVRELIRAKHLPAVSQEDPEVLLALVLWDRQEGNRLGAI